MVEASIQPRAIWEILAKHIIRAAQRGERNPRQMTDDALLVAAKVAEGGSHAVRISTAWGTPNLVSVPALVLKELPNKLTSWTVQGTNAD